MQTVSFKQHGGLVNNSHLSLPSLPWWNAVGPQAVYCEPFGQLKNSAGDQLAVVSRQSPRGTEQVVVKENHGASHFTISPGGNKDSVKERKPQQPSATLSRQTSLPGYQACFELGLAQPMVCANYPYIDQCYGVIATYGTQTTGRIMLPLNVNSEDGPIYVNPKQYHGIIRRRLSRAKAEQENKQLKPRKPYMHESRHQHALRRARGCGGRFLTKEERNGSSAKGGTQMDLVKLQGSQHSGSTNSEVLQSESRTLNSPKGGYSIDSSLSGSEVTSIYSRGNLEHFQIGHLRSSAFHSLSHMIESGQGMCAHKWVTAADGCCDLLKV